MHSLLPILLAGLSLASQVRGYDYEADGLVTGITVIECIFSFIYIILSACCVIALAFAKGHRLAYLPLQLALFLALIQMCVLIGRDFILANGDPFDDFPGNVVVALGAIDSLLSTWKLAFLFLSFALLIKGRANSLIQSTRLSPAWDAAYLGTFVLLIVFGIAWTALYTKYLKSIYVDFEDVSEKEIEHRANLSNDLSYTFSAIWYTTVVVLGALGVAGYKAVQKAGITDRVLKTLLFVAFPLHVLHVVEDFVFTILFSPSGLKPSFRNINVIEGASLASVLLSNVFHAATAVVIIFVGIRRSNWTGGAGWQKGQYPTQSAQAAYPMQGNYPQQASYPVQVNYPQQATYPAQVQ